MSAVLGPRALNRATLRRQLLLDRTAVPVVDAVSHLVGLQAQLPLNPYVGLWSRLDPFSPEELGGLLHDRRVVRIAVMRSTIHLVTADDCLLLRPLVQPVLDRELARHREYAPALAGVDLEPVLTFARTVFAERPRTGPELRAALAARFPDLSPAALAYACRNHLAIVQVPPRGVWGRTAPVTQTTAESWLGRPLVGHPSVDDIVLRYFAAFGPASVADVGAWSSLTALREVVERLRPRLREFRDERGRELFDVPDGPRPDPETPAPPRFLPEYDNVLLSHADRTRFVSEEHRRRLFSAAAPAHGSLLVDGFAVATWHVDRDRASGAATLTVEAVARLTAADTEAVAEEGRRLLQFLAADADDRNVDLRGPY